MKKTLSLLLAVLLVLAMFAGCANNDTPAATPSPDSGNTDATPAPDGGDTPEPTEEPSPYNLAAGKFKADENGLALEKYEYELPLSTTDEVFDMWTSNWTPGYLPEDGYGATELPQEALRRTGVNMEYVVVSAETRAENFAVLLASDDLCDIMCNANNFYSGTFRNAVEEEEYFVNVYDYREYMPNYIYEVTKDPNDVDTIRRVFTEDDLILSVYTLRSKPFLNDGPFIRGDWLAKMGKINDDIVTYDDLHEVLTYFKSNIEGVEYPTTLYATLEMSNCFNYTAFDTYLYCYGVPMPIVDGGKIRLANMNEQDRQLMTMMNSWYSEGLIDPNWSSYSMGVADINDRIDRGEIGYVVGGGTTFSAHDAFVPAEAGIGWVPVRRSLLHEDQTLHLGFDMQRVYYGSGAVATTCENIPLVLSWLDYRYSEEGSFLYGYGVKGVSWEYTADGSDIRITDYIVNHPAYWGMIMCTYALNHLVEPGLAQEYAHKMEINAAIPANIAYLEGVAHDNSMTYPTAIALNDEQNSIMATVGSDINTYVSENFMGFLDGSNDLGNWDSYVDGLYSIGIQDIIDVYQEAYDDFMAK